MGIVNTSVEDRHAAALAGDGQTVRIGHGPNLRCADQWHALVQHRLRLIVRVESLDLGQLSDTLPIPLLDATRHTIKQVMIRLCGLKRDPLRSQIADERLLFVLQSFDISRQRAGRCRGGLVVRLLAAKSCRPRPARPAAG